MDTTAIDDYWEDYDGQNVSEFKTIGFNNSRGELVFVPIESDIKSQIREIKRINGRDTGIKVYKSAHF